MKRELLSVKNVCFGYDDKAILKNVSLSIYYGEKIAVMGPNGAGKSTFLLNINGVLTPDEGEIFLEGNEINKKNISNLRKNVGFVFQNADDQIIASTVRTEISFGPMNLKLPKDEVKNRVENAMDYLDLTKMADRPPHYLSGGEKKRVSIADIIAMKAKIMIFDEPMSALDNINSENVENILNNLHDDGTTLVVATHDTDFAYRFADRIIIFMEGNVIADGVPDEIFSDDSILKTAHLKKPLLLEINKALQQYGILDKCETAPKNIKQMIKMINAIKKTKGEYENE
ncbi:MAG: ABC transporter ATP-binding protein [Candidatus Metalachnospira sp.]|nr:ABC transporter ATP-binding protein [Candidatus Metalachnospira sp.]